MTWNLGGGQIDGFRPASLAQSVGRKTWTSAGVNGGAAPEIREGEGGPSVPTIGGAQEAKDGLILGDGKELTVTKGPATWGEVAPEHDDFCEKWIRHSAL